MVFGADCGLGIKLFLIGIVFQINILAGVQTLVWQYQAKAWTPFMKYYSDFGIQLTLL